MNLKNIALTVSFLILLSTVNAQSHTKVIAHRGYWKTKGSAQNSIASLVKANEINVYGSEFDVWFTSDGKLVINHDPVVGLDTLVIEDTPYSELKDLKLVNGEKLPTLANYLEKGKECKNIKLIIELKPHSTKEKEDNLTQKVIEMVQKFNLENKVEYISFSLNIVKELIRLAPTAKVFYLNGDLSPRELKEIGCAGLDYNSSVMKKNEQWFDEAKAIGLLINVWTVNKEDEMHYFIDKGADFITTNEPETLKRIISEQK